MDAERESDLILLAGDLTTYGEPEQAAVLADVARGIGVPVYAQCWGTTTGANRHEELVSALRGGGIHVLERASEVVSVGGVDVGIVGTKGFIGGFTGSLLPDFGEPLLRRVYAETSAEVSALDRGLRRVSDCAIRIVLLHYAPTKATIEGEPETIWTYLGSERLAEPIAEHRPDLVLHGHGHGGTFAGVDGVPVQRRRPRHRPRLLGLRVRRVGWFGARARVDPLAPDDLDQPAAVALAVELEEEHTLPGAEAELAVPNRYRLAGAAEGIDMQWAWPLPRSMSSSQMFSVRRSQSSWAWPSLGTSRRSRAAKSSRKPFSNSLTRTQQVVCGE